MNSGWIQFRSLFSGVSDYEKSRLQIRQKGIIISSAAHLCIILADGCQRNAQVLSKILHEKQRQEQQRSGDLHRFYPLVI
jgi:hypothetical protein